MAFGTALPARLAPSGGSVTNCSGMTVAQLQNAIDTVAPDDILDLGGDTFVGTGEVNLTIDRDMGGSTTTIRNGTLQNLRILPTGAAAYWRIDDILGEDSPYQNFKVEGTAGDTVHHIEVVSCAFRRPKNTGGGQDGDCMYVGAPAGGAPYNIQIWDVECEDSMFTNPVYNFGHGIYWAQFGVDCVLGSSTFERIHGFGLHVYPGPGSGLICTAVTLKRVGRPAIVISGSPDFTDCKFVGIVSDDAEALIYCYDALASDNRGAGLVEYSSSGSNYQIANFAVTGYTTANPNLDSNLRPQSGSSVIDRVPTTFGGSVAGNPQDYLPALDKDGNSRVTADAGAYAFGGTISVAQYGFDENSAFPGYPSNQPFQTIQAQPWTPSTQGASNMGQLTRPTVGGVAAFKFDLTNTVSGAQAHDRAQAYYTKTLDENTTRVFSYEFMFPSRTTDMGQVYLLTETGFMAYQSYGPPTALFWVWNNGSPYVIFQLSAGELSPTPPLYEYNSGTGSGPTPQNNYAIPAADYAPDVWHQLVFAVYQRRTPDGTIQIWHRKRGDVTWDLNVNISGVKTMQLVGGAPPSTTVLDVVNAYRAHNTNPAFHYTRSFFRWADTTEAFAYFGAVTPPSPPAPDPPPVPPAPPPSTDVDFQVTLDGTDVTQVCVAGSWTRRLNRPSQAQVRIPSDQAVGGPGSRLLIECPIGTPVFHGFVLLEETDQGEDTGYVTYNAQDPMELWQWRPVRDDTCDFSLPTVIMDYVTGPQIMETVLRTTVECGGGAPADTEGPIFLDMGTFETGGCDLTGAPTDWPMTIAQLASLLISTGCLDLIITPTNPGGGIMGTVDGYNGDYGTDLSGSVVFEYGTGARNMRSFRRARDMTTMANKIWYYAGPRIRSARDPSGDQHWCFNVVATDPCLPDPIPNGQPLTGPTGLITRRENSQDQYGVRMDIQIFDAYDDLFNCVPQPAPDCSDPGKYLYRNRWETESWIRAVARDLVHVTPIRGLGCPDFDIGDLVGIEIPILGVSAAQRVYAYTVSWDEDSVLALSELQTSDTADA